VVTGNDNKVGDPVSSQKKSEEGGGIQGGSSTSSFINESVVKTPVVAVAPASESKEKSFWGGILEGAGNIFVKKV
jgi:hypothetical protein